MTANNIRNKSKCRQKWGETHITDKGKCLIELLTRIETPVV